MKKLIYKTDSNEEYEIYINGEDLQSKDFSDLHETLQRAQRMMKGYALFAIDAFRSLGEAKASEIVLEFGLNLGGKTQIPSIAEGSASGELKVQIKFKFPDK